MLGYSPIIKGFHLDCPHNNEFHQMSMCITKEKLQLENITHGIASKISPNTSVVINSILFG